MDWAMEHMAQGVRSSGVGVLLSPAVSVGEEEVPGRLSGLSGRRPTPEVERTVRLHPIPTGDTAFARDSFLSSRRRNLTANPTEPDGENARPRRRTVPAVQSEICNRKSAISPEAP